MSTETDRLGVIGRLSDRPYLSTVSKYWQAAAYDSHLDRDVNGWLRPALVLAGIVLVATLAKVPVLLYLEQHPALLPAAETVPGTLLGSVATMYNGGIQFVGVVGVLFAAKCVTRMVEEGLEGDE